MKKANGINIIEMNVFTNVDEEDIPGSLTFFAICKLATAGSMLCFSLLTPNERASMCRSDQ